MPWGSPSSHAGRTRVHDFRTIDLQQVIALRCIEPQAVATCAPVQLDILVYNRFHITLAFRTFHFFGTL